MVGSPSICFPAMKLPRHTTPAPPAYLLGLASVA
jgi:hypothetical protein